MSGIVILKDAGVIFTVESALISADAKLREKFGKIFYNCPFCGRENSFSKDDIAISFGWRLTRIKQYVQVANDFQPVKKAEDFITFLITQAQCNRKHYERYGKISRNASIMMTSKCSFCEKSLSFNISSEAEIKTTIPVDWMASEGLLSEVAGFDKESVEQTFLIYEKDPPETYKNLMQARDLIEALSTRPLSFKNHEKVAYLIKWAEEDKNPMRNAEEFQKYVKGLQNDIKKTFSVANEFKEAVERTSRFENEQMSCFLGDYIIKFGANCTDIQKSLKKKAQRLLADALLWLKKEVERLVFSDKITSESFIDRIKSALTPNKAVIASEPAKEEELTADSMEEAQRLANETRKVVTYRPKEVEK
jgi:hypothetical protein